MKFPSGHPLPVPGPFRHTNGELKSRPADPYRISIGVSVWTPDKVFPKMTQEQLDDPKMVQRLLTEVYRTETPFGNVRQRFFPNDIPEELSWIGDPDSMRIAEVVEWSCSRYPAVVPKVMQNPSTGKLVIMFDGASVNTHPDLWMEGFQPIWDSADPMKVIVSRGKGSGRKVMTQASVDFHERGWENHTRSAPVGLSPLAFNKLTVEERHAMFLAGFYEAGPELDRMVANSTDTIDYGSLISDRYGRIAPQPPLHGFNLLLEDRATAVDGSRQLGW